MVLPIVIFNVCGLNEKVPLSVIDTFTVVGEGVGVGGFGVGLGLGCGVGVGVGTVRVGTCVGADLVGVGLGREDVGVSPGCVDVGVGELLDVLTIVVLVLVKVGVLVAALLLPPQPASIIRRAAIQRPHKTTRRDK
jgi:hypothetical protein